MFDKQLLEDILNNMWVSGCTFQLQAKEYNTNFLQKNNQRLGDMKEFVKTKDVEWLLREDHVKTLGSCG